MDNQLTRVTVLRCSLRVGLRHFERSAPNLDRTYPHCPVNCCPCFEMFTSMNQSCLQIYEVVETPIPAIMAGIREPDSHVSWFPAWKYIDLW